LGWEGVDDEVLRRETKEREREYEHGDGRRTHSTPEWKGEKKTKRENGISDIFFFSYLLMTFHIEM
jgi:hypothetical protein